MLNAATWGCGLEATCGKELRVLVLETVLSRLAQGRTVSELSESVVEVEISR